MICCFLCEQVVTDKCKSYNLNEHNMDFGFLSLEIHIIQINYTSIIPNNVEIGIGQSPRSDFVPGHSAEQFVISCLHAYEKL